MAQLMTIRLNRQDAQPWGFRLQGGKDFGTPLVVQKVNGGSLADQAGLIPGDAVININNVEVFNLRHKDAQDVVVRSGNNFDLTIQRGGGTWRPTVTPTGSIPSPSSQLSSHISTVTRTSLAHKPQEVQHIGSGYNNAARPFSNVNGNDGPVKSIVNKQYNTPVGIYSEEAIAETLSAQAEVLAGGVLGVNFKKNEKIYSGANSEVLKMLHEQENDQNEPAESQQQQYQQPQPQQHKITTPTPVSHHQQLSPNPVTQHVKAPIDRPKAPNTGGLPAGQNICAECERLIVGVFIRIKDKNLHAECFKCATCGTSLKNQGYFNFNNKLYCDIHARLAAMNNPPKGTEGYSPVPIATTQKLSANTISAALESHVQHNGSSNINTGYGGPKPFNTGPMNPPMRAPQSPSTYPPPTSGQSWAQPQPQMQPKPQMNPYATLPRASAQSQDTPRELTPSVEPSPVVMQTTSINQHESASHNATRTSESYYQQQQRSSVPIIVTENSGPITMAFQSLDVQNNDHAHPRPFTPSLINKPAPVIPFYQTTDQLVAEECSATQARLYDPRSPSPLPGRTRSPAPGPPPNPLKAIRAPRMKEAELGYRPTQAGSITTGQSYYGAQAAQYQTEQQGQLVSHYQTGYQSGAQTFVDKPEVVQQRQIGDMTMQTRAKESKLSEENRSELQSKTTTQVGNVQIERHRKVIEEFEHTQSAKSMEILKTHGESRQIGKTGFVANQTRRLSGLEQEISAITSQSQAISARAANLREYDETIFPQFHSPEPVSKFPLKPVLPPYDEPQRPTYVISQDATNKLVNRPPGYGTGPAYLAPTASSYATLSSSQGQSAAQSSITASSVSSSAAATAASSNLTTAIPVPAFKPPVPFGGSAPLANISEAPLSNQPQFLTNNQQLAPTNNAYKPTPSIGPAGFKAPPPPSSNLIPNVVNDPSPASAGPNKGGVFGATSAPKRGRGILNKAVGLGARAPLCGCCNSQIRGPFITALGRIWCPDHFVCVNGNCRRALQDIGFVEEKGDLYCEYCFEKFLAPTCNKCNAKIKGDCLNAIGKHFHPECFTCTYCGKLFGNSPFFLEEGEAYCEADWNELFTTKCFACGFPVEAGDRWVEALSHNYHSQCFNCTMCKKNLEGQSFYNKGGRPFCKNHAR